MGSTSDTGTAEITALERPSDALDAERAVRVALATVRQALSGTLVSLGFHLTADQLTRLEAHRGGSVIGTFSPRHRPITASISLDPVGACCRVLVHLSHPTHLSAGTAAAGTDPVVAQLLDETLAALDTTLARLDPSAAERFRPPVRTDASGRVETGAVPPPPVIPTASDRAVDQVGAALVGASPGGRDRRMPEAWRRREGVLLVSPDRIASLTLEETQAHLAVAAMVIADPDALPAPLARQLERLAVRIEHALADAADPLVRIALGENDRKAFDFVHLQVLARSRLPVRTLQRCRDCRFEKVTNPDLVHLVQRNRRLRSLTSAFGATVSRGGISPFVLVGTLFQLKSLDPDYVCPRCQGVSAESTLVTFCPMCGDLRKDAVLRTCPRCHHDFRSGLAADDLWVDPPEVAAATLPLGSPLPGPGGGVRCSTCGGEFSALWRVVALDDTGTLVELFVCGTTEACMPDSLTVPVSVGPPARAAWPPPTPA